MGENLLCKSPGGAGGGGAVMVMHNCRKGAVLKNRTDALFVDLSYGGWTEVPIFG